MISYGGVVEVVEDEGGALSLPPPVHLQVGLLAQHPRHLFDLLFLWEDSYWILFPEYHQVSKSFVC